MVIKPHWRVLGFVFFFHLLLLRRPAGVSIYVRLSAIIKTNWEFTDVDTNANLY